MIRCKYQFAGSDILLDARSNRISVINVLDELVSPGFPVIIPKLSLCFVLARGQGDPDEVQLSIRATLGEAELMQGPVPCNFQSAPNTRLYMNFHGFAVSGPGELRFSLRMPGGQELGAWSLEVTQAELPKPQMELPQI